MPAGLTQFAVANLAKPLVGRYGFRPVLTAGLAGSAAGLAVLATSTASSPIWWFEVGLGLLGAGIGLTMPPATGAIMSSLPPPKAGVGSAVNDLVRELGGAFGIGVLGSLTLVHYRGRLLGALAGQPASSARYAEAGLAQAFAVGGGPGSPLGVAARYAYAAGLDLGMMVGAGCAVVAAAVVCLGLRGLGQLPSVSPAPAPDGQTTPPSERLVRGPGH